MVVQNNTMRNVLFGLIVAVFFLLIIEFLLRIGYTYYYADKNDSYYFSYYSISPQLGWEPTPGYRGKVQGGVERQFDLNGFVSSDTSQVFDRSKHKIVFLGDSITFGHKIPTESTFVEKIKKILPNVNAINLGVEGYTSYQGYEMLKKRGLKLSPDIVVASFNFNDRRYVLDNGSVDSAEHFKELYKRNQYSSYNYLKYLYIYRAMEYVYLKYSVKFKGERLNQDIIIKDVDQLYPRVSFDSYRKNLIDIIELSRSRGIDVILMILKDNPVKTEYITSGVKYLEKSNYDLAMDSFTIAARMNNTFSVLGKKYLKQIYNKKGLKYRAENINILENATSSIDGEEPIYLDVEYNQIMREVAEEYNIELVDAGSVLNQHPSYYLDDCHPDEDGHQEIANLLAERIQKILRKRQLPK